MHAHKKQVSPIPLLILLMLLATTGCQEFHSPTTSNVEFPGINLSGQCRPGTARVECEDASTTDPRGQIATVTFRLINARTGNTVETQSLSGGCATAPSVPCEVVFRGLAIGRYEVVHTLETTSGEIATTTYGDLEVG
jgi:hypothetical protein